MSDFLRKVMAKYLGADESEDIREALTWPNGAALLTIHTDDARATLLALAAEIEAGRGEEHVEEAARMIAARKTAAYNDPACWKEDLDFQRRFAQRQEVNSPILDARLAIVAFLRSVAGER